MIPEQAVICENVKDPETRQAEGTLRGSTEPSRKKHIPE